MIIKQGEKCYALYVNLTTNYVSFKIEVGKLIGNPEGLDDKYYAVEHRDDEVNYLQAEDIFKTEHDAFAGLAKMLKKKINK